LDRKSSEGGRLGVKKKGKNGLVDHEALEADVGGEGVCAKKKKWQTNNLRLMGGEEKLRRIHHTTGDKNKKSGGGIRMGACGLL